MSPSEIAPIADPQPARAVILFARSPRHEARAKRLRRAGRLFELGRDRVLEAVEGLAGVSLVVVGEPGTAALPAGTQVLAQRGGSFGERLTNAFDDVRALGYEDVLAVGIDAPTLSPAHLARAFGQLEHRRVVFGPAADGGVYLVGLRGPVEGIFDGVCWQTAGVLEQLLAGCPEAALLPATLSDVDDLASLRELLSCDDLELAGIIAAALTPISRAQPPTQAHHGFCRHPCPPISRRGPPPYPHAAV